MGKIDAQKILIIISVILLNLVIYILTITEPAIDYELSIYSAYPFYFFIFLILSYICSLLAIFLDIVAYNTVRKINLVSIFVLFIFNIIIILLPVFRGYTFYDRHDALTHMGRIKDILTTNHLGESNFYPVLHLEIVLLHYITDLRIVFLREIIPIFFFILYIVFIYFISFKAIKNRNLGLISILFALVPLINRVALFSPSNTLFFIIPFLIYLWHLDIQQNSPALLDAYDQNYTNVRKTLAFKLIFVLVLFLVPFMHPEVVIFLSITFILFLFTVSLRTPKLELSNKIALNPVLILITVFFAWFSSFSYFFYYTHRLYLWFFKELGSTPAEYYQSLILRAQLSVSDFLQLLVKIEGAHIVYILLAFWIIVSNFRNLSKNIHSLFYCLLFITLCFIGVFAFFNDVVIGYERVLRYILLVSTILISIFFIMYLNKNRKKMITLIFVILVVSTIISTFNMHNSPIISRYNQQVTKKEISGTNWLIEFGNKNIEPVDMFLIFGRFVHANLGYDNAMKTHKLFANALYQIKRYPPDHFNYGIHNNFGYYYPKDKYLLTNKLLKLFYSDLFPAYARFTSEDFKKLNNDRTVDKIYANTGLTIWYIYSSSLH